MINKLMALKSKLMDSPTKHWLLQRITAVALIPLTYTLIMFLHQCLTVPYDQVLAWLKSPWHIIAVELWLLLTSYHVVLGLHVVVEDYVANEAIQLLLIKIVNLVFLFSAVTGLYFIFRIH